VFSVVSGHSCACFCFIDLASFIELDGHTSSNEQCEDLGGLLNPMVP